MTNRASCIDWRAPHENFVVIVAITAGGPAEDPFARSLGVAVKALAIVNGTTLLARSIAAARGCGAERIAVIGSGAVREACAAMSMRSSPKARMDRKISGVRSPQPKIGPCY